MDDTVNLWVLGEDLLQARLVGDVAFVEVGSLAAEQLDAIEGDLGGVVEAVNNDNIVAMLEQGQGSEGTDVACATATRESQSRRT